MNEDNEHEQDESSSCHLLGAVEDLLKRSHNNSIVISKKKCQSKSLDDLFLHRQHQQNKANQSISNTTHIELDLSGIGVDEENDECDILIQQSRSAPASPTKIYDKELAAFIQSDQQQQETSGDSFIFNIDLSDSNENSHQQNSKLAIFFEDDYSSEEINYEPSSVNLLHSSLINNCLTITEENEEELEQLEQDDDKNHNEEQRENILSIPIIILNDVDNNQTDLVENDNQIQSQHMNKYEDNIERLSTIYESPSPQLDIEDINDDTYDKLIVYDIANINTSEKPSIIPPIPNRNHISSCYTNAIFESCPNFINTLSASNLCGTTNTINPSSLSTSSLITPVSLTQIIPSTLSPKQKSSQHVKKMKVIQSSSSSLSDFISPISYYEEVPEINGLLHSHCLTNPIPRRTQKHFSTSINNNHCKSEEKLSSDSSSSSSDLILSTDEKLLSRSEFILQHEQNISQQQKSTSLKTIPMPSSKILYPIDFNIDKNQTSDSGIIIDTSKTSTEEDDTNQDEINYQKILKELTIIKNNIVDVESRLNEAMRELEIEQSLIESEHELIFKQILESSESDQQKIRQLHKNLQLLIKRIMTEKKFLKNQIDSTQQILIKLDYELNQLEQQYSLTDERIIQKQEMIVLNRKKYEDLEFQLMELETRSESELEQAEEYFQTEQNLVTQNARIRQTTLQELDHQQYMVLHQITLEKEKLERERQKLKLLFKQKKFEASQLEQKLHSKNIDIHQSTPKNLYNVNGISSLKKDPDYQVKLREKNRAQERPLTRYLPVRSVDFDLRAHIESAGHSLESSHIYITSTSCRGYLHKMGGMKFKTWNRRWFVFDRQCRSLFYYEDKTETKLRGCINFQSILEVYIDHLQSISLRSPEPRQATFIVKTIQRPYYLVAPTIELMRIWIDVIITGAEGNTFAGI